MSQDVLGASIGTSRSQVANIETGGSSINIEMLFAICLALHCSPADIIPGFSNNPAKNKKPVTNKQEIELLISKLSRCAKRIR